MKPYRVTEVNNYINKTLSTDIILSDIKIEGEISNYVHHRSGHMYFNLKDEDSRIKCVMFKFNNKNLDIDLEEGMKIVARGNISVYERDGSYQLYVKDIEVDGLGQLYREFEELKNKLKEEGLFDEGHKKELPRLAKTIGVVTSGTGAAIKDIITVIKRRFPATNIIIYPSLVQGKDAPKEIIRGLKYLDKRDDIDLIIFGRGGGSIDELFAFNDETLARTIYNMEKPTISAVGHEVDFTISDFVADLRAATPSAAAELAVPNVENNLYRLEKLYNDIVTGLRSNLIEKQKNLGLKEKEISLLNPLQLILNRGQDLDNISRRLQETTRISFNEKEKKLLNLKEKMLVLNPKLGLEKGYGIILSQAGKLVKSIEDLEDGQEINIILKDGKIRAVVNSLTKEEI